ncbi:MAG: transketolase family protein [Planctomycetaceae bacterium]|jgi:transketolase|nr:transketolase family protein [Planctomycetaceae bacterium]
MTNFSSVNIRTWSRLGQRGTFFGVAIPEIAKTRDDIRVVTSDLALLSGLDRFKKVYPDRFLNVGIAEQNMIGVAAGLAKEGNCVFATTYATFLTMRSFEQIRHNMGYQNLPVKAVGSSAGLAMGTSGNTHYAFEDLAVMRAIPNLTVLSPSDSFEAYKMAFASACVDVPMYIRLTGTLNCPIVYQDDYEFEIGKAITLRNGTDVTIIACGTMVHTSLEAAKILESAGISAAVINMHTIKPLDKQVIETACKETRLIVTVEEHNVIGGLGSAVAEYKSALQDAPAQLFIGIPDTFCKPGDYQYLLNHFGLKPEVIAQKIIDYFKAK